MAFNPSATDYGGMLDIRRLSDKQLTQARMNQAKAEREGRVKKSGERSGLAKLGSAAARGALAYYTGGASEAMGFGGAVDEVMLGTDSEGRPIRNEYGELVKTGSAVYGSMKDKKAADIAKKRASNIQDYKQKVDLAEKMGVLDKKQGARMLLKAEELRAGQKKQTAAADEKGVWGWDDTYDALEMTPAQVAGKEESIRRHGRKDAGMIPDDYVDAIAPEIRDKKGKRIGEKNRIIDRRESAVGRQFDESSEMEGATMGETQTARKRRETNEYLDKQLADQLPSMEEVEAMYERDKKKAFMENPDLASPITPSTSLNTKYDKQRQMEDMMEREYNKKLLDKRGESFDPGSGISDAELEANEAGMEALIEAQNKPSYRAPTPYKTYSEKEAEKLSRKDTDKLRAGTLDDIAIDNEVNRLQKRYSDGLTGEALKKLDKIRRPEDAQLWKEFQQKQKEALKREHKRTGGPDGDWKKNLILPTSALMQRLESKKAERAERIKRFKERVGALA